MNNRVRQTQGKKAIQEHLTHNHGPISEAELRKALIHQGLRLHKTTLYRQLEALVQAGWATVTRFADGIARYERCGAHHHHLVCDSCHRVEEILLDAHLQDVERRLSKKSKFRNIHHSLEFFGTCTNCVRRKHPSTFSS